MKLAVQAQPFAVQLCMHIENVSEGSELKLFLLSCFIITCKHYCPQKAYHRIATEQRGKREGGWWSGATKPPAGGAPSMLASDCSSVSLSLLYSVQLYFFHGPSTAAKYAVGSCTHPRGVSAE